MIKLHFELKNGNIMIELLLGSKKVFPQNYHAFEGVKRLENNHFHYNDFTQSMTYFLYVE